MDLASKDNESEMKSLFDEVLEEPKSDSNKLCKQHTDTTT